MSLDRLVQPQNQAFSAVNFLPVQRLDLSNGLPVLALDAGSQDLVRIELEFYAGKRFQPKSLVSAGTNYMLKEGTSKRSATALAEAVDYYGAFLQVEFDNDLTSIVLYSLNKHLNSVIPLLSEAVSDSVFPEEEIELWLRRSKQKYLVESDAVRQVAQRHFPRLIFGEGHPYGQLTLAEHYDQIKKEDLVSFYKSHYSLGNAFMTVAGKLTSGLQGDLESLFGHLETGQNFASTTVPAGITTDKRQNLIEMPGKMQSAIRIGRLMFDRKHPDFLGMQVLTTVLGGYFGSRLMSNIREDKGYTYGIGAACSPLHQSGYFFISTEVGADVCQSALDEIYKEIAQLRDELIPDEELELVRNYMMGAFLRNTDGPFAQADRLISVHAVGLDFDYYAKFIDVVQSITAEELKSLAEKYLQEEDLIELVVGKR